MGNFGSVKPHVSAKKAPVSNHPYHKGTKGQVMSSNDAPKSRFPFTQGKAKY